MKRKITDSYIPHSSSMKEYLKNFDKLEIFEYIISEGAKDFINKNSVFLDMLERETYAAEYQEVMDYALGAKSKSKFLMHFSRQQFFTFHVHLFEYFLLNFVRELYRTDPRALISSKKQITVGVVATAREDDRLLEELINAETKDIGKGSYENISEYLKEEFKIVPQQSGVKDEEINEIFQLRHVIVHNNGIIDREFKNKVKSSRYIEGKRAYIDPKLFDKTRVRFMRIARYLDSKYYDKFSKMLSVKEVG